MQAQLSDDRGSGVAVRPLRLRVLQAEALTAQIRRLRLGSAHGEPLPGWTPGAHIRVRVQAGPDQDAFREYSLVNEGAQAPDDGAAPADYTIAVRLEESGRGGSRFMHQGLQVGDEMDAEAPRNDFELEGGAAPVALLAGGIGVTPLISMAAACRTQGRAVTMLYAGRSRGQLAFLAPLQALLGKDLQIHADDEAGRMLDVANWIDTIDAAASLYVCGPQPLLDAVLAATRERGWAPGRLHFELFSAPVAASGDRAFEVVLAQSGRTFTVPAGRSLLDCLIDQGCDPLFDCRRGECGVCAVGVIEGEIDHRDYVLMQSEKDAGQVIQTCVSRARGPRLVLDL